MTIILNVCCGKRYRDNMINIDVVAQNGYRVPDILADARKIPLPDGHADEVMSIHGFEHFYRWEVDTLITEWKRLLKPGGLLVLELPDLIKCAKNVLSGYSHSGKDPEQFSMWGLYGDPRTEDPYMCHRWAWSPATLAAFLRSHGFKDIVEKQTEWHPGGREHRDMRIEARKG
jgi:ubiquinone/menaquinone biosynthesis C-methylase UbiE